MEVKEAISKRRSHRKYQPHPIPEEVLSGLFDAMRLAPSGSNRQPWRFIVVTEAELRQQVATACHNQQFIAEAPVVLVACAVPGTSERGALVNVSIALDHLTLAATEVGLGTCWIGAYSEPDLRAVLQIPDDVRVVMVMPLGYPADEPAARPRKPKEEIICYNQWQ